MTTQNVVEEQPRGSMPASARERAAIAERSSTTGVQWESAETSNLIRLWDNVDDGWSQPFERGLALQHYLRKVLSKCSVCKTASAFEANIRQHIVAEQNKCEAHEGAELGPLQTVGGDSFQVCTGCGNSFQLRKRQGARHLELIEAIGPLHRNAEVFTIKQFSLEPPAPVTDENVNGTGPVDIQVERSKRRRRRSRPRGRKR